MKPMLVVWQRLVKGGETCDRCDSTGHELEAAVTKLAAALRPLGIEPVLETQALDEVTFKRNPAESNRVWIAGKPIEEWLGARVGMSRCCSVCGELDCRTLEVDGHVYDTIPEALIVRAGLLAAGQLIAPVRSEAQSSTPCCDTTSTVTPDESYSQRAKPSGRCCSGRR